jgi:hypothetical protein
MNDELEEKIKKMNLDELKLYEKTSVFAKRVVGFIGVHYAFRTILPDVAGNRRCRRACIPAQ